MPDLLRSMIVPTATVAIFLPIVILIEMLLARDEVSLKSRWPGAFMRILLPGLAIIVSWPLAKAWGAVGVGPAVLFSALPWPFLLILALLVVDFLRYWEHRFEHWNWWSVHSVHHSVRDLNAANAYAHPFLAVPEFFIVSIPLSLMDFGGVLPLVWLATTFNDMFIHSPIRLNYGPLRHVLVSQPFHRIHHSLEERHFDKNFGLMFTLWDRIFGTAYFPKDEEWPAVGVEGLTPPHRIADYAKINWPKRAAESGSAQNRSA